MKGIGVFGPLGDGLVGLYLIGLSVVLNFSRLPGVLPFGAFVIGVLFLSMDVANLLITIDGRGKEISEAHKRMTKAKKEKDDEITKDEMDEMLVQNLNELFRGL